MQRSILNKNSIASYFYVLLFVIYESISSTHLFLPPLAGLLFFLFARAIDRNDTTSMILLAFCFFIYDVDRNFILFSSVIYFFILYKWTISSVIHNLRCSACLNFLYPFFAYVGFFVLNLIVAKIFLMPLPDFSFYILYYIALEFLIVSLL